jgi:hypothetical protein
MQQAAGIAAHNQALSALFLLNLRLSVGLVRWHNAEKGFLGPGKFE